jgi:SRSO17 transposase
VGAQRKEAQGLQWFLSESSWSPEEINRRRVEIMLDDPRTAPQAGGALVVDETGDRKDGKATAHVGKQYLGGIGKIDNGVVSVSSLWVDERIYYPIEVEPYTPAHHFEGAKVDPDFRTKPQIALELVERAVKMGLPFRAVVGDILYGEHRKFKEGLEEKGIPYVLSLKPSHTWWHPMDEVGWVEGVALASYWGGSDDPGEWVKLERRFRDERSSTERLPIARDVSAVLTAIADGWALGDLGRDVLDAGEVHGVVGGRRLPIQAAGDSRRVIQRTDDACSRSPTASRASLRVAYSLTWRRLPRAGIPPAP